MTEPTESGRKFEREIASLLGAELVPGSGNQWFAKLDVQDDRFLWSLKWTGTDRFMLTPKLFSEIHDAMYAPGGIGRGIAGAIVSVGDVPYLIMDLNDAARVLTERIPLATQKKADAKVERSRVPLIFRDQA